MVVFNGDDKERAVEPYREMCRALAKAFGGRSGSTPMEACRVPDSRPDGADEARDSATARSSEALRTSVETPHTVHVLAYQHRYGVDFSVHATLERAYHASMETARRQCLRDEVIRGRVERHFGHWLVDRLSMDEQDELVAGWDRFAEGEAIWISTCEVEACVPPPAAERSRAAASDPGAEIGPASPVDPPDGNGGRPKAVS